MTTEDHNRTLGILHLVYGGLHLLFILMMSLFFVPAIFLSRPTGRADDAAGAAIFAMIVGIIGIVSLLFSVPSFVAGFGMLKRKSWAKVWSMIAGGIAGMSFPMGTALCVYTFWFLFSGGGKELYDPSRSNWRSGYPGVLHGAPEPASWESRKREQDYVNAHRSGPPDWRGE